MHKRKGKIDLKTGFRNWAWALIVLGVTLLVCLVLFQEALGPNKTLFSGDGKPHWRADQAEYYRAGLAGGYGQGGLGEEYKLTFGPQNILRAILPPEIAHEWVYILHLLILGLGMFVFLRSHRLEPWVCAVAALGLVFSGYVLTLLSAGHRVFYCTIAYAPWVLAFLRLGILRGQFLFFLLAGFFAGMMFSGGQQDTAVYIGVLAAFYSFFLLVRQLPASGLVKWLVPRISFGILAGLVAVFFAITAFSHLFEQVLVHRKGLAGKTAESKWDYATSWSMPPESVLEFAVPNLFGNETRSRDAPYWGKLGRSKDWESTKQGFRNYREHNLYLGIIPCAFACLGIVCAFSRKRRDLYRVSDPGRDTPLRFTGLGLGNLRPDVLFWGLAFLLAVLVAMGRYVAPLYKVVFSLPYFGNMRTPVKHLHTAEIAIAVLCAIGLHIFWRWWLGRSGSATSPVLGAKECVATPKSASATKGKKKASKKPRPKAKSPKSSQSGKSEKTRPKAKEAVPVFSQPIWKAVHRTLGGRLVLALLAIGMCLFALIPVLRETYGDRWLADGYAQQINLLEKNLAGALAYAGFFFILLGTFVFAVLLPWARKLPLLVPIGLLGFVIVDGIHTGSPYIHVRDVSYMYGPNRFADRLAMESETGRVYFNVASSIPGNPEMVHPDNENFASLMYAGLQHSSYFSRQKNPRVKKLYETLGANAMRLWQVTNTGTILGPAKQFQGLAARPDFTLKGSYIAQAGRYASVKPEQASVVELGYANALPRAAFYSSWQNVDTNSVWTTLAAPGWNPATTVLVESTSNTPGPAAPYQAGRVIKENPRDFTITTGATGPGYLLVNMAHHKNWSAKADGKDLEIVPANGAMMAIWLDAGQSEVDLRFKPQRAMLVKLTILGYIIMLGLLGWVGVSSFSDRRSVKS